MSSRFTPSAGAGVVRAPGGEPKSRRSPPLGLITCGQTHGGEQELLSVDSFFEDFEGCVRLRKRNEEEQGGF